MKLTLAMGLQYDNGRADNMFALSLGQSRPSTAVDHAIAIVPESAMQMKPSLAVVQDQRLPFFLTYNLQGLHDTLMVDGGTVDLFV